MITTTSSNGSRPKNSHRNSTPINGTGLTDPPYPRLRPLDIRPHAHNGESYLMLRDPFQLSDQMILVPRALGSVLAFCDGSRSVAGVTAAVSACYQTAVETRVVEQLLSMMDDAFLLDNDRAAAALKQTRAAYRQQPYRPAMMAGAGYPADPDELAEMFDLLLGQVGPAGSAATMAAPAPGAAVGLLSPHIDYPRGGAIYAKTWRQAAAVTEADLVIVFATDHYGSDPFTLTRQHYATPYGVLPTAVDVVDDLAAALGEEASYAGELRHRGEHSIELVLPWLHHMRRRQPVEVVPILCGSFYPYLENGASPASDRAIQQALDVLREQIATRRVVVVASGDMAHVGSAFGGAPLTPAARAQVHAADDDLIAHMCAGDAAGFFASIRRVRDQNNVCGVSPIYLTMQLLGDINGSLTGYASCPADDYNTSTVTISGVIFQPA